MIQNHWQMWDIIITYDMIDLIGFLLNHRQYVLNLFVYRCLIPKPLNYYLIVYSFLVTFPPICHSWWGGVLGFSVKLLSKKRIFQTLQRQGLYNQLLEMNSWDCWLFMYFAFYLFVDAQSRFMYIHWFFKFD